MPNLVAVRPVRAVVNTIAPIVINTISAQGPKGAPGDALSEIDKTLVYTGGVLTSVSDIRGTKTFNYVGGVLTTIVGTGIYASKTFHYTGGVLTSITIGV